MNRGSTWVAGSRHWPSICPDCETAKLDTRGVAWTVALERIVNLSILEGFSPTQIYVRKDLEESFLLSTRIGCVGCYAVGIRVDF